MFEPLLVLVGSIATSLITVWVAKAEIRAEERADERSAIAIATQTELEFFQDTRKFIKTEMDAYLQDLKDERTELRLRVAQLEAQVQELEAEIKTLNRGYKQALQTEQRKLNQLHAQLSRCRRELAVAKGR